MGLSSTRSTQLVGVALAAAQVPRRKAYLCCLMMLTSYHSQSLSKVATAICDGMQHVLVYRTVEATISSSAASFAQIVLPAAMRFMMKVAEIKCVSGLGAVWLG